jgi:uncharacterized protein YutE (UPF0331/DUF86 family)
MADASVVATKLEQIERYHGELLEKRALSREQFLDDITERRAVERMFENSIQASTDLAKHVAAADFGFDGDGSKAAIRILADNDVVSSTTATTLVDAVGFRNVLAHEYGTVDPDRVYEYLQNDLDVYPDFARAVAIWFESR